VTLGVKVYPLPEESVSRPVTLPFTTFALITATEDPGLVGSSILTVGGLVSLYPLPLLSRVTFLIPLIRGVADPPLPPPLGLIETLGGYSNRY